MNLNPWRWLRQKLRLDDPNGWRDMLPPTYSNRVVNDQTALQLSSAWACVRLKAQTCGSFPLQLFKPTGKGNAVPVPDHELSYVTQNRPSPDFTATRFWTSTVAALDCFGNAYAEKMKNEKGSVIMLDWLAPRNMNVQRNASHALEYKYTDEITKTQRTLQPADVLHIRNFNVGGDVGLSAVSFARNSLGAALDADESAGRFWANGMRPSGWLKTKGDKILTEAQREQVRKNLIEPMVGNENAAKVGILEGGFDWLPVTINPEDSQLLETRRFSVEEICRWFDVPPILIGHAAQGQTMWGSGVEQIFIGWLTLILRPLLTNIEKQLEADLLNPEDRAAGMFFRFNFEALLRADSSARATFNGMMVDKGIYTRNEVRAKENLPPLEGGDVLTVQSQMIPLGDIGKPRQIVTPPQQEPAP